MSDEGFLRRWSRLKADPAAAQPAAAPAPAEQRPQPATMPALEPQPPRAPQRDSTGAPALPTLDDVARLHGDSDFSVFVAKGVDKDVRRLAMKKLFSDPHFNLIDRLDVYMDDFNKPSPMSAAMLAALHHTRNLFAPLAGAAKEADADAGAAAGAGADVTAMTQETGAADDAGGAATTADDTATTADDAGGAATTADTTAGVATTEDGAAVTDAVAASVAPVAAAAPVVLEPMQFHGAAAGGVFPQTLQGKA